jgi:hypothetical protein
MAASVGERPGRSSVVAMAGGQARERERLQLADKLASRSGGEVRRASGCGSVAVVEERLGWSSRMPWLGAGLASASTSRAAGGRARGLGGAPAWPARVREP